MSLNVSCQAAEAELPVCNVGRAPCCNRYYHDDQIENEIAFLSITELATVQYILAARWREAPAAEREGSSANSRSSMRSEDVRTSQLWRNGCRKVERKVKGVWRWAKESCSTFHRDDIFSRPFRTSYSYFKMLHKTINFLTYWYGWFVCLKPREI